MISILKHIATLLSIALVLFSCENKEPNIEYANNTPNPMAGNWIVFELPQGDYEGWPYDNYTLVTATDPNRDSTLVINKLYNSSMRIRVPYSKNGFNKKYVDQIDTLDGYDHHIHYVSLDGLVSKSSYVQQLSYQYALNTFPDMDFDMNDIDDVIVINAGFYDFDSLLVDTVLIFGYRKTGFEDVPID